MAEGQKFGKFGKILQQSYRFRLEINLHYLDFNTCTALGCLETGVSGCSKFPVIHQNGVRFHNRFAFHEDYGLPTIEEEAEALGTIHILRQHIVGLF